LEFYQNLSGKNLRSGAARNRLSGAPPRRPAWASLPVRTDTAARLAANRATWSPAPGAAGGPAPPGHCQPGGEKV